MFNYFLNGHMWYKYHDVYHMQPTICHLRSKVVFWDKDHECPEFTNTHNLRWICHCNEGRWKAMIVTPNVISTFKWKQVRFSLTTILTKFEISLEANNPSNIATADRLSQTQRASDSFVHRDNWCIIFLCNLINTLDRPILWSFISQCYVAQSKI